MGKLATLAAVLKQHCPDLKFGALEIGAMPLEGQTEPLHPLISLFPNSELFAFEPDQAMCEQMNASSPPNVHFIAKALGAENGTATLYETENRSCYSLYQSNMDFCSLYRGMESMKVTGQQTVTLHTLDSLLENGEINTPDTIKIDVQGAELDIFKGATKSLESALLIVSEVEFVPLYKDQPLFSDVDTFLREQGFMFHKFSGTCGRDLAPVDLGRHINLGSQQMWSDAIFIRDIAKLPELASDALLRLALFAIVYQSPDLTYHCLSLVDQRDGSQLTQAFMEILRA